MQFLDRVAAVRPTTRRSASRRGETWESVTWKQAGDRVERLAAGLLSLGIEPEQRVGIAVGTRYEWILADLAVMCAGGATTTVYPSTNAEDTAYILGDSECRFVFAEDDAQIAKLTEQQAELPHRRRRSSPSTAPPTATGSSPSTTSPSSARPTSPTTPDVDREDRAGDPPDQLATLIYTSGTTGRPKGVRLLHQAWVYEGEAIKAQDILDETDLQFLWLPMAHSFGKVLLSTQLACGFATAIDGRVDKIVDNLGVVKPTFMGAAPRIFEKAYARIVTMQAAEGGAKEKIFNQAFEVGIKVDELKREGKSVPLAAQAPARPLRQAGLQQGPRALRRPGPVLHLRLRRAQRRDRRVVPRRRHPDPRGLRHDRERRRRHGQPPRRLQDRHGRPGAPRQRGQDRRGRRGHAARARTSWPATTTCPRRPRRR